MRLIACHLTGKDRASVLELDAELLELRRIELGYVGWRASHLQNRPLPLQNRPRSTEL